MPPLRVPADLVARAHADPLGDGPVLGHLLRERPLGAERLVRRLRGGRGVRHAVASLSRGACVQRSADPRWGRRDATTGGAFRRRPVRRPAGPLGRGARKSQGFLRDDGTVRVSVRPVALACARRARGRAAAFLHANSWAGPRSPSPAFRCKPARGAIDSPYRRRARVSVCRRNVPWLRNCPSPRLSSEDKHLEAAGRKRPEPRLGRGKRPPGTSEAKTTGFGD